MTPTFGSRHTSCSHRLLAVVAGIVAFVVAQVGFAVTAAPAQAATLPSGFTETQFASGFTRPYTMAFAPDGRLFVAQQGGKLRVVKNGVMLSDPFVTLTVDSSGDRGLIGVAFDPDFETNHYVYVYYTATTPASHNRVSRFTANGDVAVPGSEQILLELDDLGTAAIHNGGSLHFGKDGKLYISTGENATPTNAQSLDNLLGKMLRINPDGTIPTDNPFYNTASGRNRAIWALGLRNPFTFKVQPGTGRIFINDVGAKAWEEINEGIAGANYGWPDTEGYTSDPRYTSPVFAYSHGPPLISDTTGCAIVGGSFYNPSVKQFPSEYEGDYFFADNCSGWMRKLDPANGNTVTGFASGIAGPVDIQIGPDGSLYYLSRPESGPGAVYKVDYSGLPAISQQPTDQTVAPGQPATFSVRATGQQPLSYQWQRNGVDIPGATAASYTLDSPSLADSGAQFRCVVSNALGTVTSNSATLTVTDNTAPAGTVTMPTAGTTYNAGDTITYQGTGTDAEDGDLPASAFTWEVVFHHNTHTHSFIPPFSGVKSGTFTIPDTGETDADVFYRIHLTVTDSDGLQHTSHRDVIPNTSTISLATSPVGLQVTLDAQPKTAPYSTMSVVGMKRMLGVVSPQTVGGVTYEFDSWSDGGAATHEITTPASDTTYTAVYRTVPDTTKPTVSVTSPAAGATVTGTVNLTANASDNSGVVTSVKWYIDSVQVASDTNGEPWTRPWNSTSVADGTHKIFAKARDPAGNWGTSKTLSFTVANTGAPDTTPPTVSISSPAAGATVTGTVSLAATASDNSGVNSVKWYVDNVEVASDSGGAPWTAPWDSSTVADGSHNLIAKAFDAAGNVGTSSTITFSVVNQTPGGDLFSDGFESGDFSAWTIVKTGADGAAIIQASTVKSGTYAAKLSETAATGSYSYARKSFAPAQTDLTVSGDFQVVQEGVSGGNVPLFRLLDSTGARIISLARQNLDSNKIRVTYGGTGYTTTGRLPLGTWANLELHIIVAGTGASTVEVRLNGALVYQTSSASLGAEGVATLQIGNDTTKQTFTVVADNIAARV